MKKEDLKKSRQYRNFMVHKVVVVVPSTWCVRFDLTPTELLALRYIQFMTTNSDAKAFIGSQKTLCTLCNCSLPTARKACDKLYDRGWINKMICDRVFDSGKTVDWVRYVATVGYDVPINSEIIEELLERELTRRLIRGIKKPKLGE